MPLRWLLPVLLLLSATGCGSGESPETLMQRAQEYQARGKTGAAVLELKNLLEQKPSNPEARLLLGSLYVQQQNGKAAEKQLLKAQRLGIDKSRVVIPLAQALLLQNAWQRVINDITVFGIEREATRARILTLRGYAYYWNRQPAKARESFVAAHEEYPDAAGPLAGLALLELVEQNTDAALDYVRQALAIDPQNMEALGVKGRIEQASGDLEAAEASFRQAAQAPETEIVEGQRDVATGLLVSTLLARDKKDEALEVTRELLARKPGSTIANYLRAVIAYDAGDLDTAGEHVRLALTASPRFDQALRLKARIDYAAGNLEQANAALADYAARHPEDRETRKLLAATRLRMQQPAEALSILDPLLEGGASDPLLLSMAARANFAEGNTQAGARLVEQAAMKDPGNRKLQLQLALARLRNGQNDEALEILRALPETADGIGLRERLILATYTRQGETAAALALLERYLEATPDDTNLLNLTGAIHAASGSSDEARRYFEQSLAIDAGKPETLLQLARLELRSGQTEQARKRLDALLGKNPDNLDAMYLLAALSEQRGDRGKTIEWMERARSSSKTAVRARLVLIRHYLDAGAPDRARTIADEAVAAAPQRTDTWNALGVVQMETRDWHAAVRSFDKALALDPDSTRVLFNQARAQAGAGDDDAARQTLLTLTGLEPANRQALSLLAMTELRLGNTDQALTLARELQKSGHSAQGLVLEGDLLMTAKRPAEAVSAYRAAAREVSDARLAVKLYTARKQAGEQHPETTLIDWLDRSPADSTVRILLASHYAATDQIDDAIQEYEKLLEVDPRNAGVLNNLAWLYSLKKDSRAVKFAERAHALAPEDAATADTLGWVLVQNGQYQRAADLLAGATTLAPDQPTIRYHYAVALARSGDPRKARRILEKLLESGVDFPEISDARSLVETL